LALGFYPLQRVGGSFHRRSRRHPVSPFNSVLPVRAIQSTPYALDAFCSA